MAIVDARILRSLTVSERKSDKGTRQLSGSEEFLVISDTKDPSFGEILASTATFTNLGNKRLPQINDAVQVGSKRFYVTARDLSHFKDNERAVRMTVRYDSKAEEDDEQPDPPNGTDPETWQRITIQTQQMTGPALGWIDSVETIDKPQFSADQDVPRNSAGDPVDGLEEDTALIRMTYTNTQVPNPNFQKLQEYTNTCNTVDFLGALPYTVRCVGWSGEYDQANQVWSISIEFLFKPTGWVIEFYDVGFNEIVDGKRRAILDLAGNPVSKPVPLDGNGKAAAIGNGGDDTGEQFQPVALEWRYLWPYPSRNLNNIWNDCRV